MQSRFPALALALCATLAPVWSGAVMALPDTAQGADLDVRSDSVFAAGASQEIETTVIAQSDTAVRKVERVRTVTLPDVDEIVNEAVGNRLAFAFTGRGRQVKNAPYSAEIVNEKTQTLPDGNQITQKSTSRIYRDGLGSTRQDIVGANGEVKAIHIRDAEGNRYFLTAAKKTAIKIVAPEAIKLAVGKNIMLHENTSTGDGHHTIVKRIDGDGKQSSEEVRVVINDGAAHGMAGMGEAVASAWQFGEPLGMLKDGGYEKTSTTLGSRDFDGVRADGKGSSYTIPAGKIGNKGPIAVTSETWYSPDLQVTIYSKQSDPRNGDTVYRLANVKRGEPSPELFKVPADYAIDDPMAKIGDAGTRVKIERFEKK